MRQLSYWLFAFAVFGLTIGPLCGQATKDNPKGEVKQNPNTAPKVGTFTAPHPGVGGPPQGPCWQQLDGQKLVFIINGAGGSTRLTDNLSDIQDNCPNVRMRMQTIDWCRGDHASHDYIDHAAQLQAAAKLAGWTRMAREHCPNSQIYFVAFSAGTRVALAAAEMLPPCYVDRIVLMASTVSAFYDLRPALRVTRGGIYNFWNAEDQLLESIAERLGTSDGAKGPVAGKIGFRLPRYCAHDPQTLADYSTLYQLRLNENMAGHGGHSAWTVTANLKRFIVPLIEQPIPGVVCQQPAAPAAKTPPMNQKKNAKEK